jgi:histidinol phosphatase-like PHP family hydrolase
MIIVNPGQEDYHMHSLNFSDGWSTIDEIVRFAGEIGLKKIAITDHSDAELRTHPLSKKTYRSILRRWANVHNQVEVLFGVEGDILNQQGDINEEIQGFTGDFLVLSAHPDTYHDHPQDINLAYRRAIEEHHKKIDCIGHPDAKYFSSFVDMRELVRVANDYGVALEFNCVGLLKGNSELPLLEIMLERADRIYVNSDAHTLNELRDARTKGFEYLRNHGLI